jgi:auxin efflux carrier family protein
MTALSRHVPSDRIFKTRSDIPQDGCTSSNSREKTSLRLTPATAAAVSLLDPVVFKAGLGATAKLLSSIALGGFAATKRMNILDGAAVSALSRLTYWVFQPAFLLCSVSSTFVTASAASSSTTAAAAGLPGRFLALMPLIAALQIAMGAIVGKVVCKLGRINDESEQSQVQMCTTFGNSGPLPLIFSEALFAGAAGRGSALFRDVAACISFYLLVWSPLFWSFGRVILGTYNNGSSNSNAVNGQQATFMNKVKDEVKKFLSPPVIGSILGVLIGTIPVLRSLFFGGLATPLFGAIATLGTAYLPAALLVLAGSLVGTNKSDAMTTATTTTPTRTIPSVKSIAAIFLSRFLVAPSLSFLALTAMSNMGLLGAAGTRARAVVSFAILAEGCMPPAQNSVIMLQLEGLKERASSMAKLLTILYAMAVVPVTILLSVCLAKSGILAFQ